MGFPEPSPSLAVPAGPLPPLCCGFVVRGQSPAPRTSRPVVQEEAGLRAGQGVRGVTGEHGHHCSGLRAWALPASSRLDLRECPLHSRETEAGKLVVVGRVSLVSRCFNRCADHLLRSPPLASS